MKQDHFGQSISALRKQKGWTQEELGRKLGVSAQAVSKWETGQAFPDITLLTEIASLFGVSIDTLFDYHPEADVHVLSKAEQKDHKAMQIRVHVSSSDGDEVNINVPLSLARVMSKGKNSHFMTLSSDDSGSSPIDWNEIIRLIDEGVIGKIVEIDSAGGDHVEIYVS